MMRSIAFLVALLVAAAPVSTVFAGSGQKGAAAQSSNSSPKGTVLSACCRGDHYPTACKCPTK